MTACNLWVGPAASYLLTDTAAYHSDGTVLAFASKVAISSRNRIAVATNGITFDGLRGQLATAIDAAPTQAAAMRALSVELAALQREASDLCDGSAAANGLADPRMHAFVALWSSERRRAEAYYIAPAPSAEASPDTSPTTTPAAIRGVRCVLSPPIAGAPNPLASGFDAAADGRRLIEAQRSYQDAGGACRVGGSAELTVVDAGGVWTRTIRQWPDQLGQRIAA